MRRREQEASQKSARRKGGVQPGRGAAPVDPSRAGGGPSHAGKTELEREFESYAQVSRRWDTSVRAAVPLFAVYEAGLLWFGQGQTRNTVDYFVRHWLNLEGGLTIALLNLAVLCVFILSMGRRRRDPPELRVLSLLFVEGLVWACVLVPASLVLEDVARLAAGAPDSGPIENVIFGLGAGLWEELVFRLLLLGGAIYVLADRLKLDRVTVSSLAVVVSALAFSGIHHLHEAREDIDMGVFVFRFLAGVFLGLLFITRGFGVTCWTHALYNLLLASRLIV